MRLSRCLASLLLLCVTTLFPAAAATKHLTGPAPGRTDERVLRDMESRLARAVASKDVDSFLAFWAEDAAIFPPGGGPVVGREKILESWSPLLKDPDVSLTWEPTRVEMAASGDLGYTYGRYESRKKGSDGEVVTRKGCYVTIWRKEKDGAWRVVLDIGSPDPPPAAEAAGKKPAP